MTIMKLMVSMDFEMFLGKTIGDIFVRIATFQAVDLSLIPTRPLPAAVVTTCKILVNICSECDLGYL